jgi:hypothetical protein
MGLAAADPQRDEGEETEEESGDDSGGSQYGDSDESGEEGSDEDDGEDYDYGYAGENRTAAYSICACILHIPTGVAHHQGCLLLHMCTSGDCR